MGGAVELTEDLTEIKEDKTNLTTRLYEHQGKKQRCLCKKVLL
jgi:hypothetical protein